MAKAMFHSLPTCGVIGMTRLPTSLASRHSAAPRLQSLSAIPDPLTRRRRHPLPVNCRAVSKEIPGRKEPETVEIEEKVSPLAPTTFQVGSFKVRMKRGIGKAAPVAPLPPPVPSKPMLESIPAESVPVALKPTVLSASIVKPVSNFGLLEAAADAGLLFVTSPKVGYFRKGRVVKGKTGPPLCEEGQVIKEGQVVCYLEQFETQQPVEADISGEVIKVLWEDGEPVGYGDPLIAIRPAFPGIKLT